MAKPKPANSACDPSRTRKGGTRKRVSPIARAESPADASADGSAKSAMGTKHARSRTGGRTIPSQDVARPSGADGAAEPAPDCTLCPRLVSFRTTNRDIQPDWFNAPVPSFGNGAGRLLIVGLAPGLKGANRTGRPFTGDYAGDLLYATLLKFGFARGDYEARPDDGLKLVDCMITNAVRCVPPKTSRHRLKSRAAGHSLKTGFWLPESLLRSWHLDVLRTTRRSPPSNCAKPLFHFHMVRSTRLAEA